jgi:hypothetical protein
MATYTEHTVTGLKQAIGRQANIRRSVEKTLEEMNQLFANALGAMYEVDLGTDLIEAKIWQYVEINEPWWSGDSERVGVLTRIGDYTNKKGQVSKVHFSQNGKYIKPAKEGDQPCSYIGNFRINQEQYEYDFYQKEDGNWVIKFEPK